MLELFELLLEIVLVLAPELGGLDLAGRLHYVSNGVVKSLRSQITILNRR